MPLARALLAQGARFVVIGVWGANYYAMEAGTVFQTRDGDLLLPQDPNNLVIAWSACEASGFSLWIGDEPLDVPRDRWLAERVIAARSVVRARDAGGFAVDLTLAMAAFDFEEIWRERRVFLVDEVEMPVARLEHIVRSKATLGRPKDQLFLATHADALRQMFGRLDREETE